MDEMTGIEFKMMMELILQTIEESKDKDEALEKIRRMYENAQKK